MEWKPEQYNRYKDVRYKPFYDLLALLELRERIKGIDLGCGTGEQTAILQKTLPNSNLLGIDSSPQMLAKSSRYQTRGLRFELANIQDAIARRDRYDLVFSNAALQWIDSHELLLPKVIDLLAPGGQLAIQMPVQNENLLNKILLSLVAEEPFRSFLDGFKKETPVLSIDKYAQLLFDNHMQDIQVSVKVYPIIASSESELYDFIAGSALLPYTQRLSDEVKKELKDEFLARIRQHFKKYPAIYVFKRLLLYAKKGS